MHKYIACGKGKTQDEPSEEERLYLRDDKLMDRGSYAGTESFRVEVGALARRGPHSPHDFRLTKESLKLLTERMKAAGTYVELGDSTSHPSYRSGRVIRKDESGADEQSV